MIKRFFFAGLLVWLPLLITVWVLHFIIVTMDSVLDLIPEPWQPKNLLGVRIPGLGVLLALIVFIVTGLLAANFVGQKILSLWDKLIKRIPIVNSIYTSVKQVGDTLLSSGSEAFRKAVLVPFPSQDTYSIGFITSQTNSLNTLLAHPTPEDDVGYVSVFVPTTPNPTSGFFIMVRQDAVKELPMSPDEALKMLLSLGVVSDKNKPPLSQ